MATIKIQRKHEFLNLLRDYSLFIDGQKVGKISDGQMKEITLTSGNHRIFAKIDWGTSKELEFNLVDNDTNSFVIAGFKNKLLRNLASYGFIILALVLNSSSTIISVILVFIPVVLLFIYDLTLGRKNI
jgi:hypothetical protein